MILAPTHVRAALSGHASAIDERRSKQKRRAVVAIVLAGLEDNAGMCFVERVERPGDRWSGDVAFPGGWADDSDNTLRDTAIRETFEEVGLALGQAEHLGDLPITPITSGAGLGDIGASVFYLGGRRLTLKPDPRECADAFWVPCAYILGAQNDNTVSWGGGGWPGIEFDSRVIWGLTLRLLNDFLRLLRKA